MQDTGKFKISIDYYIIFGICVSFAGIAFAVDTPAQIAEGLVKITTSRSVLITDYTELAGLGAALINSAVLTFVNLLLLITHKRKPNGRIIAALFLTIGFSLFGKNIFNAIPLVLGVRLYAKFHNIKFSELIVPAMLSATISPLVSEIAFYGNYTSPAKMIAAIVAGLFAGFIFPLIAETVKRVHNNYCLYNGGIAGGFIATFFVGFMRMLGFEITPEFFWGTAHSTSMAIIAYSIAGVLIIVGLVIGKVTHTLSGFKKLMNEKDPEDCDFFIKYGDATAYINIGIMCIMSTSAMLFLGVPINGPVLGGIFTISGFAAAGKHLKNTLPILIGSIAATQINMYESNVAQDSLAILFSTGLAPMAGKYGWKWGVVIGVFHVSVAIFIGQLNGGLNLYNNGFAGSFVALTLAPLIVFFRRLFHFVPKHHGGDE
jgi:hypothetical protein